VLYNTGTEREAVLTLDEAEQYARHILAEIAAAR
jgi:hypothetical protein